MQPQLLETSMRNAFVTVLGATAIGFLAVAAAQAQSGPLTPAAGATNAAHFSKARFSPNAKQGKSTRRGGAPTDQAKKTDPRYQQMWDPCQVEG
jgi:Spy/CpxP family protein refolding chaperone